MTLISPGVYHRACDGAYFARPRIHGRSTWRKLKARTAKAAIKENANTNWHAPGGSFQELATAYLAAHCPNRRLEPRADAFTADETKRVQRLQKFFGRQPAATLRLADLPRYHAWRTKPGNHRFGTGNRAVDKELVTLSNVINFGVGMGLLEFNYLARGRPRYRRESDVRHSRDVAPASTEIIHQLGRFFLDQTRSEVFCWIGLFAQFTGCRTSELLRLRLDAEPEQAGWLEGNMLFLGRRSKHGVNPWSIIGPEFAEMITAFQTWHAARFPKNPYFFPSPFGKNPVDAGSFGHALTRACAALKLTHITPHGYRSFHVTKRRSDGATDVQIAGEIGDKTVTLMQTTYGRRPENWRGGKPLTWLPQDSLPVWQIWLPAPATPRLSAPVDYGNDYGKTEILPRQTQGIEKVVAGDGIEPPTQGFSGTPNLLRKSPPDSLDNICRHSVNFTVVHAPPQSEPC